MNLKGANQMSKLELKSAFLVGIDSTKLMKDFLTKEMKIEVVKEWSYVGRKVIDVPKKDYERVLLEGQKYAISENISSVHWINQYNEAIECGYLQLAYAILRRKRKGDILWCLDKFLSDDVREYVTKMRESLEVDIKQSYCGADRALTLMLQGLDYPKQLAKMKEFIIREGTGPFARIIPMTLTGEVEKKESFSFIKLKK